MFEASRVIRSVAAVIAVALATLSAAPVGAQAPDDSGYVEVEGARLYYESYGDLDAAGETPLLILHGGFMSSGEIAEFAQAFGATRPVILLDQRAHGRSTGLDVPLTYERLGDDGAALVEALGLERVDVIGYSMGGGMAIQMAIRHPERVRKLVMLSATYRRDGWYDEVLEAMASLTAEFMASTPMGSEYRRLSPTPDRFDDYFDLVLTLNRDDQEIPDDVVRAIDAPTMVIVGDADGVTLEHAIRMFELHGGRDRQAAATGVLTEVPPARLLILPATSHLGLMGQVGEIVQHVNDFLDDARPRLPAAYGGQD